MIRNIVYAAVAAALVGAPASAEEIRISTTGKSPEQVRLEIRKAANKLCRELTGTASLPLEAMASCMNDSVRRANAQLEAITVAKAKAREVAQR